MGSCHQFRGLGHILLNGIMGAVKHNGGEACLNTFIAVIIGAMVQMQRHGYINVQILQHAVHHAYYHIIAAHVLSCAFGNAQDNGGLALLRCKQHSLECVRHRRKKSAEAAEEADQS